MNENEFFNRDVGAVYTLNGPVPGGLAQTPVVLDRVTGRYRSGGRVVHVQDVLADTSVPVEGSLLAADKRKGLVLLRVDGPLRAGYVTDGIYGDAWSGKHALYRRFDCAGGQLRVGLGSDPELFQAGPGGHRARGRARGRPCPHRPEGRGCAPRASRCLPGPDPARSRSRSRETRVPARVQPGATDTRALGVRFTGFQVVTRT